MGRVFQKTSRHREAVSNAVLVRMGERSKPERSHAFETRPASRISRSAGRHAERGLIAADLGGGAIKQRIARPGQGESGGFRTPIVVGAGTRAIFVHGFAKNEKDNIEREELAALKRLAAEMLAYDGKTMAGVVASGVLLEVTCDEKTIP